MFPGDFHKVVLKRSEPIVGRNYSPERWFEYPAGLHVLGVGDLVSDFHRFLEFTPMVVAERNHEWAAEAGRGSLIDLLDLVEYPRVVKWTPLSRPFFARNKLMPGGVLGLSFGGG